MSISSIVIVPGTFYYNFTNLTFLCNYAYFHSNYSFGTKGINFIIKQSGMNIESWVASFTWKRAGF